MKYLYILLLFTSSISLSQETWDDFTGKEKAFLYHQTRRVEILKTELFHLFETHGICNSLTDTPGRRDIMHMRLTNEKAFIRWVSSNHPSDYERLDAWVVRLKEWVAEGLTEFNLFIHQKMPTDGQMLSTYFVTEVNKALGLKLNVPQNLYRAK